MAKSFSLALVTGASSGIGEALCYLLASKKIDLLITGRNTEKLNELVSKLRPQIRITAVTADLSSSHDRSLLIKNMWSIKPDLIINNAGFGLYGEALTHEVSSQMEILNVNGSAVLEVTLEAAKMMISSNTKGTILNVSSVAGMMPGFPSLAVYAASKSFVNQLSLSLDYEFKPHGIRVLCACPGMVDTHFRQRAGGKTGTSSNHSMTATYAAEQIWKQIETGKKIHSFNWKFTLSAFLTKLLPKKWTMRTLQKAINERHPPRPIIKSHTKQ